MIIYAEVNFYVPICDSQYDKILKTRDYFQSINIRGTKKKSYYICRDKKHI